MQFPFLDSYLNNRAVLLSVEIVELERRRMMQFGTGPPGRQPFQVGIVDGKVAVVLVEEPNCRPLNGQLTGKKSQRITLCGTWHTKIWISFLTAPMA